MASEHDLIPDLAYVLHCATGAGDISGSAAIDAIARLITGLDLTSLDPAVIEDALRRRLDGPGGVG